MRQLAYPIGPEDAGRTVQDFLMRGQGFSRRLITRLKREPEHIRCNGRHIRMIDRLAEGDRLWIALAEQGCVPPNPALSVPILYEDQDAILFQKPAGMPVHPSVGHHGDTLANFFAFHLMQRGEEGAFHPLNRLDRDTTGLCLAAKHALAARKLAGTLEKEYAAVVYGALPEDAGVIDAPIGREDGSLIRRCVRPEGKRSVTHYQVVRREAGYTWVRVWLETGRTHQIRVHFAHLGYPLAGDDLYGGSRADYRSQALCCSRLRFLRPEDGKKMDFCINIQGEWEKIRNK